MNSADALMFASKRDAWLSITVVFTDLVIVFAMIVLIRTMLRTRQLAILPGIIICIVSFALLTSILVATHYHVREGRLFVRSGPFKWQISIADIQSVHATRNPLSSPALSLDRLSIQYHEDGNSRALMVSPLQKDAFVQALHSVNPGITLQ
jgi:hypothetical protein